MSETLGLSPTLEERLTKLESQNRRQRIVILAILVAAISLGAAPTGKETIRYNTVEAGRFLLRDSSGKTAAALQMESYDRDGKKWHGPELVLYDVSARPRMRVRYEQDQAGLDMEEARAEIITRAGTPVVEASLFESDLVIGTGTVEAETYYLSSPGTKSRGLWAISDGALLPAGPYLINSGVW